VAGRSGQANALMTLFVNCGMWIKVTKSTNYSTDLSGTGRDRSYWHLRMLYVYEHPYGFQLIFNRLPGMIEETEPEEPARCFEEFSNEK
jgi:hypothetical protein